VKFLRHLTAVVLVVAVIVGLGMLWAHASGGPGPGSHSGQAPAEAVLRLKHVKGNVVTVQPGAVRGFRLSAFNLADAGELIRSCVIEATLAAVVITVSAVRRQLRRRRRAATGA
jgi:hypothetical protein